MFQRYGLNIGDEVKIKVDQQKLKLRVARTLSSGGPEDQYLFVDLDELQALEDRVGKLSIGLVNSAHPNTYKNEELSIYGAKSILLKEISFEIPTGASVSIMGPLWFRKNHSP